MSNATLSPAKRGLPIQVWGQSDRGRVRPLNEDSFYCPTKQTAFPVSDAKLSEKGQLLIVADGIGGATAGQEASRHVVSALRSVYYESPPGDPQRNLAAAMGYANDSLYQLRVRNPVLGSAGSTVVVAVIHDNKMYLANVGDSRAYLIRGGLAYQSTKDHTLVQEKTERGLPVTEDDKSVITRSMGAAAAVQVDLYPPVPLTHDVAVLLCSDGLSDLVTPNEIGKIVSSNSPREAVKKLIRLANSRGGHDNITAIVATAGQPAVKPPVTLSKRQMAMLIGGFILGVLILAVLGVAFLRSSQGGTAVPTTTATTLMGTRPSVGAPTSPATGMPDILVTSTPVQTVTPVPTSTSRPVPTQATAPHITPATAGPSPTPCPYNQVPKGGACACPEGTFWEASKQWCVDKGDGGGSEPPSDRR